MRLYLIRHPQPLVAAGICYGASDLSVDDEECARVCDALLPQLPRDTPLFSSPLRRCVVLAEMLANSLGSTPPEYDARLAEMHFGRWELQSWDVLPRAEIDAWAADLLYYRPGNGESVMQAAQRVHAFVDALLARRLPQAIIVAHAGTMRLLDARQAGLSTAETALRAAQTENRIGYGELLVIER
jgi:alpha-ribazole phosphatase